MDVSGGILERELGGSLKSIPGALDCVEPSTGKSHTGGMKFKVFLKIGMA